MNATIHHQLADSYQRLSDLHRELAARQLLAELLEEISSELRKAWSPNLTTEHL